MTGWILALREVPDSVVVSCAEESLVLALAESVFGEVAPLESGRSFADGTPLLTVSDGEEPGIDSDRYAYTSVQSAGAFGIDVRRRVDVFLWTGAPVAGHLDILRAGLFHLLFGRGVLPAHGACIVERTRGLLFLGDSQSGKSTLTLAALMAGQKVVSDDAVLLRSGRKNRLRVRSLRRDLSFRVGALALAPPELGGLLCDEWTGWEKRLVLSRDRCPEFFADSAEVSGLFILENVLSGAERDSASRAVRASPRAALAALVGKSSPIAYDRWSSQTAGEVLSFATSIAENVPAYFLKPGTDVIRTPAEALERISDMIP